MTTTRRHFLALTSLAPVGLLLPRGVWAMPRGATQPAPKTPPAVPDPTAAVLDRSPLLADEPIAAAALAAATKAGASYADARLHSVRRERVQTRDDHVRGVSDSDRYGIGVRVIAEGAWGFAATGRLDKRSVAETAKRAVEMAKASAKLIKAAGKPPVELAPAVVASGRWVSAHEIDPFTIPVAEKAALLIDASKALLALKGVAVARASVLSVREEKILVTSEGTRTHQLYFRLMPSLTATAVDRRRGRFAARNHEAAPMLAGWEYVRDLDLVKAAPEVGEQALQKLHAASVTPGPRTVVLGPSNLWLTIHESIGHPTELDRAMGLEANYAGTSFIKPTDAGKLKIGSRHVTILADRTQPGGLATTGWDDDGVAAGRWPIVDRGKFVGWQTTRDQAAWIGEPQSRGCSYAQDYGSVAFQRMPNVSLQPGPQGYTTEDLINATDDGVYVTGRGSWSIDHQRYNFQFGGQMFWEIKKGRITRPLRDVAYQANTVDFWKSCDMVGGKGTYRLGGSFGDGKGQPGQSNSVSHGCPPARFSVDIVNTGGDK